MTTTPLQTNTCMTNSHDDNGFESQVASNNESFSERITVDNPSNSASDSVAKQFHNSTTSSSTNGVLHKQLSSTTTLSLTEQQHEEQKLEPLRTSYDDTKKRKLSSVFSSNQSIHDLTQRIVNSKRSKTDYDDDDGLPHDDKHHNHRGSTNAISTPETTTTTDVKIDTDNDDVTLVEQNSDMVLVNPPIDQNVPSNNDNNGHTDNYHDNDDDIQVEKSNAINACISYPHPRYDCGVHPFTYVNFNSSTSTIQNVQNEIIITTTSLQCNATTNNEKNIDIQQQHVKRSNTSHDNKLYCPNCYCYVCDILASGCTLWKNNHCHAHNRLEYWNLERKRMKTNVVIALDCDDDGITDTNIQNDIEKYIDANENHHLVNLLEEDYFHENHEINEDYNANIPDRTISMTLEEYMKSEKEDRKATSEGRMNDRVTSNLLSNLQIIDRYKRHINDTHNKNLTPKVQGDIPQLNKYSSFFVEGVQIGWPFPKVMTPQRQMAVHLIRAFKNSKHVVIESPTGTGKSAAILCATLAWLRYHKMSNDSSNIQIIYCSRTHSQVKQMVASLKKTPYRPRMAILGSREHLCIHEELRPRNIVSTSANVRNGLNSKENLTKGCATRVKNTEKFRKRMSRSLYYQYDDDQPPDLSASIDEQHDNVYVSKGHDINDSFLDFADESTDNAHRPLHESDNDGGITTDTQSSIENNSSSKKKLYCPHYQRLSKSEVARSAYSTFVPDTQLVNTCSMGGDKSKHGAHDIEDLINFGKNPGIVHKIPIYRNISTGQSSFGIILHQSSPSQVAIDDFVEDGAAATEGTLQIRDVILAVNGINVSGWNVTDVAGVIRKSEDPLILDIYRKSTDGCTDLGAYSTDSVCPYYLSRALAQNAEIIFAPYNYILDPTIRDAMDIKLAGTIVILDEAHNVEDTLRQVGSGKFGEIELCDMIVFLDHYSKMSKTDNTVIDENGSSKKHVSDVSHSVLIFLEKIVNFLRDTREYFVNDPGKNGMLQVVEECKRFKSTDDNETYVRYYGPNGVMMKSQPSGCQSFLDKLEVKTSDAEDLLKDISMLSDYVRKDDRDLKPLVNFLTVICSACKYPEHYAVSSVVSANGNLEYATEGYISMNRSFKRNPRSLPYIHPRNKEHPNIPLRTCLHKACCGGGSVIHGGYCDGSLPKWEASLVLNLLTPSIYMNKISSQCRSVVLASGSLSPISSLCAELNLLPPSTSPQASMSPINIKENKSSLLSNHHISQSDTIAQNANENTLCSQRLQMFPKPLQANHIVNLKKQLLTVAVGLFRDGSKLNVTMSNYSSPGFIEKLGDSIASIIESIPYGGILVFFPSFSFLKKCVAVWNSRFKSDEIWNRLIRSKGKVIIEPTSATQSEFEEAKEEYNETIRETNQCILLAVFRGKMSEGVSFNDNYARGVICVGLPLPNMYDKAIKAKMMYNNEQRRFRNSSVLSANEWYNQQAYRALAQAIGRCIRHVHDYGTVILLDSRHCDDGSPLNEDGISSSHVNLPKWMRHSVRTLYPDNRPRDRDEILGGYSGLRSEMKKFFDEAKQFVESISNQVNC